MTPGKWIRLIGLGALGGVAGYLGSRARVRRRAMPVAGAMEPMTQVTGEGIDPDMETAYWSRIP